MIAGGLDGVIRAFDSNSGCAGWPEAPAVSKGRYFVEQPAPTVRINKQK